MWGAMATSTKKINTDNTTNNNNWQQRKWSWKRRYQWIREHIVKTKRRQLDNEIRYLIFKIVGKCYRWSRDCVTTLIKTKPVIFNSERVCLWAWMGQRIYAVVVIVVIVVQYSSCIQHWCVRAACYKSQIAYRKNNTKIESMQQQQQPTGLHKSKVKLFG